MATEADQSLDPAAERLERVCREHGAEILPPSREGMFQAHVERERLVDLVRALRDADGLAFRLLLDVTAVDWSGKEPRFEVVYHLYSIDLRRRIRLKTSCPERDARVPSLVPVHPTANFHEREVFDMFGIRFDGHPDLRRILMPDEYEHHPLRKEFPLEGIEPEKVYRLRGGVMMERPEGAEPIPGAGSTTP